MPRARIVRVRPAPHQERELLEWEHLLLEQHGAIDTQQLAALGVTTDAITVTIPYGCSAVSQPPEVVVHRSRHSRTSQWRAFRPCGRPPYTTISVCAHGPAGWAGLTTRTVLVCGIQCHNTVT